MTTPADAPSPPDADARSLEREFLAVAALAMAIVSFFLFTSASPPARAAGAFTAFGAIVIGVCIFAVPRRIRQP